MNVSESISLGSARNNCITGHTTPAAAIAEIKSDKWKRAIESIRAAPNKDEADRLKKKMLDAILWTGNFKIRNNDGIEKFSGYLCADIDKVPERITELHATARSDSHAAAAFVSPSGTGIKIVFRVPIAADAKQHQRNFNAVRAHVANFYNAAVDENAKDVARLCFVSHDPDAFFNAAAAPLDVETVASVQPLDGAEKGERNNNAFKLACDCRDRGQTPDEVRATVRGFASKCNPPLPEAEADGCVKSAFSKLPLQAADSAEPRIIVLPSGAVSISESARVIFQRIAPMQTLFWRGGVLVELVEVDGVQSLGVLRPEKFRSDAEKLGRLYAWRAAGKGEPALKPSKMSFDDAKAIMAASEAREFLPPIVSVLRCSVLTETKSGSVAILGKGYHAELGGLLIVDGGTTPQVPLAKAVESLRWLVEEFAFQTEADRSRAIASFITPALRIGGHLHDNIPIDVAEADKSQAGKGYRLSLVSAIYNEAGYFVTAKSGGVGSMDESFAAALVSGRPFICLDNFRGKMDSQNLEAFLTCPSLFPARIPHHGEVLLNPKRFLLQMSSNGLETTCDLANRASICRIRKRPDYPYRDPLAELQRRQPYFLGCAFAVIGEWIAKGKPRTSDTRHDFREWSQTLDWIVQNVMGCAPLMDGHKAAQERTSNPALAWLRAVALAVDGENRLGSALIASELVEVCELHSIEIPGKPADDDRAKRQVGSLCKQLFRDGDSIEVDGFTVTRGQREYRKPSGDMDWTPAYTFTK